MIAFVPERLPTWGLFVATVVIVLLSMRLGMLVGALHRKRVGDKAEAPTGPVIGALMGLLAFILAITFGTASSRFDARKQLLMDDVEAIATSVRRSQLLPEPYRAQNIALLRQYVDLRVGFIHRPGDVRRFMSESEVLQRQLWDGAVTLVRAGSSPEANAYLESLNRLMAVHMRRTTVALYYRIPSVIWGGLLVLTICSMMTVGYQFGLSGRASWIINTGMAMAFASVIVIIAVLDRTGQGGITVNQQPMLNLQRELSAAEP